MMIDQFIIKWDGKSIDVDGYPPEQPYQCVDLIVQYMRDVTGPVAFSGNAKDWFYNYGGDLASKYDLIKNNPSDPNQIPQKGDIVIFGGNQPGSGGFGHIDVFLSGDVSSWIGFDQNWGGAYAHRVTHNYVYVIGWLRKKSQPQGGDDVIPDQDQWYSRFRKLMQQIRGRDMTREEFRKNFVGVQPFHMVEIVSDSPEADAATALSGQLQAKLNDIQGTINQLNQTITEATADDKTTKTQLQDALSKAGLLTTQLETAHDQIKDLQSKPAEDTKLLDSFGEWFGKLLKRLGLKK